MYGVGEFSYHHPDGRLYSALETLKAIGALEGPHMWLADAQRKKALEFQGTEEQAKEFLEELGRSAKASYNLYVLSQ